MLKKIIGFVLLACAIALPYVAKAHEVYVLSSDQVKVDKDVPLNLLAVFSNKHDVDIFIALSIIIGLGVILCVLLQQTRPARKVGHFFERFTSVGEFAIRCAIAISLIFSALTATFFGPEVVITNVPLVVGIQLLSCVAALLIAVGFFAEIGAGIVILLFLYISLFYGSYMLTYSNYLGELLVIILFGVRHISVDGLLRKKFLWSAYKRYESLIIRVFFGGALLFAAINVKFLHPFLTYTVVTQYNLTQFHWLFPADPLLVTLGAGLSEVTIALFIIFGFQLRVVLSIFFFYLTLSLLFFGESVWPHLILYGLAIYFFVTPNTYSLDAWIHKKFFAHRIRS